MVTLRQKGEVFFMQKDNGEIVIGNTAALPLAEAQAAFIGMAEKPGNPTEDDIQSWVDEARYGKAK